MHAASVKKELAPHDVGGQDIELNLTDTPKTWWERKIDATLSICTDKGIFSVHELRKGIEELGENLYNSLSYYEKWTISISKALITNKIISTEDLDRALGEEPKTEEVCFF